MPFSYEVNPDESSRSRRRSSRVNGKENSERIEYKALGANLGQLARGAVAFDPNAEDGDGDGIVQDGTPYERPAVLSNIASLARGLASTTGATGNFTNGRSSLDGMTNREVAEHLVPDTPARFVEMAVQSDGRPLSRLQRERIEALSFDPDDVEKLRTLVVDTLEKRPALRSAWNRFGAPPIGYMKDDDSGINGYSSSSAFIAINGDMIGAPLDESESLNDFGMWLKVPKVKGIKRKTAQNNREDTLVHEWGHYLNNMVLKHHPDKDVRDMATIMYSGYSFDTTRDYNQAEIDRLQDIKGLFSYMSLANARYQDDENSLSFERPDDSIPFVDTAYALSGPDEFIAEAVSAFFSPDEEQRALLNKAGADLIGKMLGIPPSRTEVARKTGMLETSTGDNLDGKTPEEIAKIVVPSTLEEAITLSSEHQLLLELENNKGEPSNPDLLRIAFLEGGDALDFSPETVETLRALVVESLSNNPVFRDAVHRLGFPPVLATKRGTDWTGADDTYAIAMIEGFPAIVINQDIRDIIVQGDFDRSNNVYPDEGVLKGTDKFLVAAREDVLLAHEWGHYLNRLALSQHPDENVRALAAFWYSDTWDIDVELSGLGKVLSKLGIESDDKVTRRLVGSKKFGKKVQDGKSEKWTGYPHVKSQYGQSMPAEAFAEGTAAILIDDVELRDVVSPELRDDILDILGKPRPGIRNVVTGGTTGRQGLASMSVTREPNGVRKFPTSLTDPAAKFSPLSGRDWLKDATNEEIADALCPTSMDDAVALTIMNMLYGGDPSKLPWYIKENIEEAIKSIVFNHNMPYDPQTRRGGELAIDFSPAGVAKARSYLIQALEESPEFAWFVRNFGSSPIMVPDVAEIDRLKAIQAQTGVQVLAEEVNADDIGGWSSHMFGIVLNIASKTARKELPMGQRRRSTVNMGQKNEFVGNFDLSMAGTLIHEWFHSFWARATGWHSIFKKGLNLTGVPGDRQERLDYLYPGNPNAADIGKFLKDAFDRDAFLPFSLSRETQSIINDARKLINRRGDDEGDFISLTNAHIAVLTDQKRGWTPELAQQYLEDVKARYPYLADNLTPLMRNIYATASRQELWAELGTIFSTPDAKEKARYLTPELEAIVAYVFGLKPDRNPGPYVKPWQERGRAESRSEMMQKATDTLGERVNSGREIFTQPGSPYATDSAFSIDNGTARFDIGDYGVYVVNFDRDIEDSYAAWTDWNENWRMRYASSEMMGLTPVDTGTVNDLWKSEANDFLIRGNVTDAPDEVKDEIMDSYFMALKMLDEIANSGYVNDSPIYRTMNNVPENSPILNREIGSTISLPLTSFGLNRDEVVKLSQEDDTFTIADGMMTDKKKVLIKLRPGSSVFNSPATKTTVGEDGNEANMPIESITAGEFRVVSRTQEDGFEVIEIEQTRVIDPVLGPQYTDGKERIAENQKNVELTTQMTESLQEIMDIFLKLAESTAMGDNDAIDNIASEVRRYQTISRSVRSRNDSLDKLDTPRTAGGLASVSSLEDRAKKHGVTLEAFNDESLDDDDVEWSSNEWSLGKTNKVMAGDVVVVRTRNDGKKELLTISRKSGPFRGALALPGGLQDGDEDLYDTAEREMLEEVNISPSDANNRRILGQVEVDDWDPRFVEGGRIAGIRFDIDDAQSSVVKAGDDADKFQWVDIEEMSTGKYPIAFGHAAWLAESFSDDPVLGPRFAVLAEASRKRNQRLIKKINEKRKSAGVKEFGELSDPSRPYPTTNEGVKTGLTGPASFERNIVPSNSVLSGSLKALKDNLEYLRKNPFQDESTSQQIDDVWAESMIDKLKSGRISQRDAMSLYFALTRISDKDRESNPLDNDNVVSDAFESRTLLNNVRRMATGNGEYTVKKFRKGDSGESTWAVYKGSTYIGDYPTERQANEVALRSVSDRKLTGLASASSTPLSRSQSDIPQRAKEALQKKLDEKRAKIDEMKELNRRLRLAMEELQATGSWQGEKHDIRINDQGLLPPATATREEIEAQAIKNGITLDEEIAKYVKEAEAAGYRRKYEIDQLQKSLDRDQENFDTITKERTDNTFHMEELLAIPEIAEEIHRRRAEVMALPYSDRDKRWSDPTDPEAFYVIHWGASQFVGGELDPARSRGVDGPIQAENTRSINLYTAKPYVGETKRLREELEATKKVLDDLRAGKEINVGPDGRIRSQERKILESFNLGQAVREDGTFDWDDIKKTLGDKYEEWIESQFTRIQDYIDKQEPRIARRERISAQLVADGYQYSSAYNARALTQGFAGYGGRYADEGAEIGAGASSGDRAPKSPIAGVHIFRVTPETATSLGGGEDHLIGKHTPIATLVAKNDGMSDTNPAVNAWEGWVDMAIQQDIQRRAGLASTSNLTPEQRSVYTSVQERTAGLASRGTPINPIGKNTEEIAKEIELSPEEMQILEGLIPNADKIAEIDVNPALKDYADELLSSVRVTVGDDGIPFIYASPHPFLSEEIPDKRNWSAVVRPSKETLGKVKELIDNLVKKSMGEDTPEEFWARSTGDGDKTEITEAFREETRKLRTSFTTWAKELLDNVTSTKQDTPSRGEFRLPDSQGQPTWLGMWAESLRNLESPSVLTFFGDNELTSHDVWGHLGTGRGFDRHGEWANMLAMFSLMDRWAEEKGISKEELLKLKASWFQTFEFGRVDGEFKPPAEQIRAEDKWYIKQWAIDSAFDFADTAELEELISLIDDGNTNTGVSKGLASTSGSELAEIVKNDIVRQTVRTNQRTGFASRSTNIPDSSPRQMIPMRSSSPSVQLKPTDSVEEAKATGRPLAILRPGTMPPKTQAAYDEILRIREEKLNEALELKARYQPVWDRNPTPPYSDEEKDAIEAKNKIRNELQFPFSDYEPFRSAFEEEFRELGFSEDEIETMRRGIVMHLTDMMPLSSGKYNQEELSDEARLQNSVESLDRADIAIAFPKDALEQLLKDGRFKTQFETKSSRGVLHPTARMEGDAAQLGYHPDTAPEMRPVYGYLTSGGVMDKEKFAFIRQYGELQFVLKRDSHSRSTYTTHDSLGAGLTPSPMGVPSKDASGKVGQSTYSEAQIHGGVSLSDVDYVVINVGEPDEWNWQVNKVKEEEFKSISGMLARVGIRVVPVRDGEILDTWNGGKVIPEPPAEVVQAQKPVKVVA
jgi:8-oxo-dGTP pyrophosphatase MutT (NUDIX family)